MSYSLISICRNDSYGFNESVRILVKLEKFVHDAHKDQIRRDGSSYFFQHIKPVFDKAIVISNFIEMSRDDRFLVGVCALLHDTVEDHPEAFLADWENADFNERFESIKNTMMFLGVSEAHSEHISFILLHFLTKRKSTSYSAYIDKICNSDSTIAKIVKFADMSCNMADCFKEVGYGANYHKTMAQISKYSQNFEKVTAAMNDLKKVEA